MLAGSTQAEETGKGLAGRGLPYLPGLDGLRALAVIAVLLYHADLVSLQGGFLGVEVFFVISGYLITSLLLVEWQALGRVDFKQFWLRRARRLLPAVFLLLIAVLAFAVVFLPEEVAGLRSDAAAAAGYVTNWFLILSHKSYFEAVGRPSLLRHLWSLAVEEQFYLAWPVLFFLLMRFLKRRRWIVSALVVAIVGSTVLMAALYRPDVDPSRVYYGTDTRAAGLLIGALLAFLWAPGQPLLPQLGRWSVEGIGFVSLMLVMAYCVVIGEYTPFLYQGGFAVVSLTTAALIAAAVHPQARWLQRVLGWEPLRWVGLRSYGIYLWHWPVYMITRPQLDVQLQGVPLLALRLAATLLLAELSYRYVELPVRQGALERAWHTLQDPDPAQRRRLRLRWSGFMSAVFVGFVVLGQSVVNAQPPALPSYLAVESINTLAQPQVGGVGGSIAAGPVLSSTLSVGVRGVLLARRPSWPAWSFMGHLRVPSQQPIATRPAPAVAPRSPLKEFVRPTEEPGLADLMDPSRESWRSARAGAPATPVRPISPLPTSNTNTTEVTVTITTPTPIVEPPAPTPELPPPPTAVPWGPDHVSMIGDSVMLGSAAQIEQSFADVDIDAHVGRQVAEALNLLQARKDAHQLGSIVVVHVGNNGTFTARQFDDMMTILSDRRLVVLLNIKIPRNWEGPNNAVLMDGVKRYGNVVLLDWRAVSSARPDLFWGDGMHLRPEGARVYVDLIMEAIAKANKQ